MTTITTTEAIPTTSASTDRPSRLWRYAAAFAGGIALSVAVAAGVTAMTDDDPSPAPAPTAASTTGHSTAADVCPLQAGQPC